MNVFRRIQWGVKQIFIAPIRFYKRFISPALPPACRYYPSCSVYMMEAIQKRGAIVGLALGSWRILRCNPWSHGGYDPVPLSRKQRAQGGCYQYHEDCCREEWDEEDHEHCHCSPEEMEEEMDGNDAEH